MSREAQELLAKENAWPSIRDDAYGKVPPEVQPTFTAIGQALADGWFRPSVSYWPEVTAAISQAVDRILLRQEPPDRVLDELHDQVATAAVRKGSEYPPT
jgi:ABC-type glycerol-3-phosphate transport system substrate-binding protein